MKTETISQSLSNLGRFLKDFKASKEVLHQTDWMQLLKHVQMHNAWFDEENVSFSFDYWINALSDPEQLNEFVSLSDCSLMTEKSVGLITAGNIPLAGFHDWISILASGHKALIKVASEDAVLMKFMLSAWQSIDPAIGERTQFENGIMHADAYITSGTNNSSRYFEYYFRDKPAIIRHNRNSVALLTGDESEEELAGLARDIFQYYGMGCRSVSKVYVPQDYDLNKIFNAVYSHKNIMENERYMSNYTYNKGIFMMARANLLENGFFMLIEEKEKLSSPISSLFYQRYTDIDEVSQLIDQHRENLQCVVATEGVLSQSVIPFGETQTPSLTDFADNVNTINFLSKIK